MRRRSGQSDPLAAAAALERRPDRDYVDPPARVNDARILVWVADFDASGGYFNYYGKNCCPTWQPPFGVAGVRNKYDWTAESFALDSDYAWIGNGLTRDGQFCVVEDGTVRPSRDGIQESNSMGAGPFHALNQTEFYFLDDDIATATGINRLNNPIQGSAIRFRAQRVIMSIGFFDYGIWAECENEPRSEEWRPFFNGYHLPKTTPCLFS